MPIDVYDFYNMDPKSAAVNAPAQTASAPANDDHIDVMDFAGGNAASQSAMQAQPTITNKISDFAKATGAGILKPIYNTELGLAQLGISGAGKLGLLSPQEQSNYQGALQKINQLKEQKYPTGTAADIVGQSLGYAIPSSGIGKLIGAALPATTAEVAAAPTLGGALARTGLSTATGGLLGATSYNDPNSGISRGAQAALGALASGAGQVASEGVSGAINYLNRPDYQQLGSSVKQLLNKKDEILNNIAEAQDKVNAGGMVQDKLLDYGKQLKNNYTNLYDQLKNSEGKDLTIADTNLAKTLLEVKDNFGDKLPPSIQNKLNQYTLFNDKGNADLTVEKAIDLTKSLNQRWANSNDPAEKYALSKIKNSLYDSIDMTAQYSPAARVFQQARDARVKYSDIFEQDNLINDIVSKGSKSEYLLKPEQIVNKITGGSQKLYNTQLIKNVLQQEGSPEAEQAWNSIRRSGLEEQLLNKSVNPDGSWNSKAFVNNYRKLGNPFIDTLADDPQILGQLRLLHEASKYDLNSANLIANKIKTTLKNNWKTLSVIGGAGAGLHHIFSGEEAPEPSVSTQDLNQ